MFLQGEAHTYEYDIDLESDVAPARVLRMVGRNKRVLEIGAGPGSITRHLSGTLGCHVVALEIDPSALEKLMPHAQQVYAMDLNDSAWNATMRDKEASFDVVIAADVLEHVYDPWSVLGAMKSLLNETGSVILSIPHVGHAAIGACLLDEDFEYRQWGLLDKTHIRFFGIKNIQDLYASQDLAIEECEFVVRTPEMTEFVHRWRRLPVEVRRCLECNRFSHVYQVVCRAVPKRRAHRDIRLMDLEVPAPTPAAVSYWTSTMASIFPAPQTDLTSTIAPGAGCPSSVSK